MKNPKKTSFLVIEGCDFKDYPVGGILSFSKQLISVYKNEVALVGMGEKNDPLGFWFKKKIGDIFYDYFAFMKYSPDIIKPKIPLRLTTYINLRRYKNEILSLGVQAAFVRSHEILKVVIDWPLKSVCYYFPGVGSPLKTSHYKWVRIFSGIFDRWYLNAALKADVLLAAADQEAIESLKNRCGGLLKSKDVKFLSTRVDAVIFNEGDKYSIRDQLGLDKNKTIFVTTGRIHPTKGWKFLLKVLCLFKKIYNNCLLIFVGDGSDRIELEKEISRLGLNDNVKITGFLKPSDVARHIQASDLFLLGSKKEGWSTSLIEALACYKPVVTTRVSSATSIVRDGINGFVVDQDDVNGFVNGIEKALLLKDYDKYINKEIPKYSLDNLRASLEQVWNPERRL